MIENILQLLSDYGWQSGIFLVSCFLLYKFIIYFFNTKKVEIKNTIKTENNLSTHSFFNNVQYRLVVEIPSLDLIPAKPVKQQMFRDILSIETKILRDICLEIIKMDMTEWNNEYWVTQIISKINEAILNIEKRLLEEGIPHIVIRKYLKWHYATLDLLFDYIKDLGNSNVYNDNISRTNTFLLIMNFMVMITIADAEKTLRELNGEIAGKIYKNQTIEN